MTVLEREVIMLITRNWSLKESFAVFNSRQRQIKQQQQQQKLTALLSSILWQINTGFQTSKRNFK